MGKSMGRNGVELIQAEGMYYIVVKGNITYKYIYMYTLCQSFKDRKHLLDEICIPFFAVIYIENSFFYLLYIYKHNKFIPI